MLDGLEAIRDELSRVLGEPKITIKMRTPPPGRGRTPWAVVGEYRGFRVLYEELWSAFAAIEASGKIERAVGSRTLARIAVIYSGAKKYGRKGRTKREWTIGEITPWDVVISRATLALDPDDEMGVSVRYGMDNPELVETATHAIGLNVWLSYDKAGDTGAF